MKFHFYFYFFTKVAVWYEFVITTTLHINCKLYTFLDVISAFVSYPGSVSPKRKEITYQLRGLIYRYSFSIKYTESTKPYVLRKQQEHAEYEQICPAIFLLTIGSEITSIITFVRAFWQKEFLQINQDLIYFCLFMFSAWVKRERSSWYL